mgnify:CR=1 FL=1
MSSNPTILYTKTDEAPALATFSFLPIIRAFTKSSGIEVGFKDISLAGRILSQFPEYLSADQQVEDALAELGKLTQNPTTNIIKLPNISASLPQLLDAVAELQGQGFAIPNYPNNPQTDEEKSVKARYDKVRGSAVNPVLREGNSDRRAPKAVKTYAQNNPHRMGAWSADSKSHVAHMSGGDFFGSEQSRTFESATSLDIVHVGTDGQRTVLKSGVAVAAGEIVDTSRMSKAKLVAFIHQQIDDAKAQGVLFSVHLKATMMKVSDPIIFGHFVKAFYAELFTAFPEIEEQYGFNANNGIADLDGILEKLDADKRTAVEGKLAEIYAKRPDMAMVDSDKGITNLHVPNNVIIDASMPAALKTSGRMWNKEGKTQDTKFVIPDRSYAGMYQEVITFCKEHGAFDVTTMGSVSNVGLMAKKAEEYGSHDKTFEIASAGTVVVENNGEVVFSHTVEAGDIWRMCMVKDVAIRDWVKLAVTRARAVGAGVFWLNENRAHDAQLIQKVNAYLPEHNTEGLELHIASPEEAMKYTLQRVQAGQDTVSITGNVLRDYLTDLFPILELNTSAKMLSIVPLMKGGGLFETGAGGSAPKHVEQLVKENYLRWDSLGEFLALAVSLDHLSEVHGNAKAKVLGATLDEATTKLLQNNKSPARRLGQIDNRGSHFYLAMYWAQELAEQNDDADLKEQFSPIAKMLVANEERIVAELNSVQRQTVELEGYFNPSEAICAQIMRPSETFNTVIDSM